MRRGHLSKRLQLDSARLGMGFEDAEVLRIDRASVAGGGDDIVTRMSTILLPERGFLEVGVFTDPFQVEIDCGPNKVIWSTGADGRADISSQCLTLTCPRQMRITRVTPRRTARSVI